MEYKLSNLSLYIKIFVITLVFVSSILLPNIVAAQDDEPPGDATLPVVGSGTTDQESATWAGPTISIPRLLTNASNWAIGIVSFVALILIVIAGFLWATAGGDEDKIKTARQWITGAVIGIVIALMAWVIVRVVLTYFFGIPD